MENELEEDDTDSDSDGDDEDKVAPHDPNQQLRPKLPIYHPGFNLTQDISQKVLKVFTAYITTALNEGYQDAEADRLRNVISSGTKIKYHDTVKLAVAGDTGVGKSALLNAILGVINLNIEVNQAQILSALDILMYHGRVMLEAHAPTLSPSFVSVLSDKPRPMLQRSNSSI